MKYFRQFKGFFKNLIGVNLFNNNNFSEGFCQREIWSGHRRGRRGRFGWGYTFFPSSYSSFSSSHHHHVHTYIFVSAKCICLADKQYFFLSLFDVVAMSRRYVRTRRERNQMQGLHKRGKRRRRMKERGGNHDRGKVEEEEGEKGWLTG